MIELVKTLRDNAEKEVMYAQAKVAVCDEIIAMYRAQEQRAVDTEQVSENVEFLNATEVLADEQVEVETPAVDYSVTI